MKNLKNYNSFNINESNSLYSNIDELEARELIDKQINLSEEEGELILKEVEPILIKNDVTVLNTSIDDYVHMYLSNKRHFISISITYTDDDYYVVIFRYRFSKNIKYYKCDNLDGLYTYIKNEIK